MPLAMSRRTLIPISGRGCQSGEAEHHYKLCRMACSMRMVFSCHQTAFFHLSTHFLSIAALKNNNHGSHGSGNLTWVPPGPGKVRLFINTCSNPGF